MTQQEIDDALNAVPAGEPVDCRFFPGDLGLYWLHDDKLMRAEYDEEYKITGYRAASRVEILALLKYLENPTTR